MKIKKGIVILLFTMIFMAMFALTGCQTNEEKQPNETIQNHQNENTSGNQNENISGNQNEQSVTNSVEPNIDWNFLKMENQKVNKIYSPLSIRYALKMVEAGATGNAKKQISDRIGNQPLTKYTSNKNRSLANALFVRDSFAQNVKESYQNALKTNYDADVIFDAFASPENVNTWVSNKTLHLIDNLLTDIGEDKNFLLINALGIDMEWKQKFLYLGDDGVEYIHEDFYLYPVAQVSPHKFGQEEKEVSGMEIRASINNYDIVKELGEENIRQTVGEEYRKWAKSLTKEDWEYESTFNGEVTDEKIEAELKKYLDGWQEDTWVNNGYIADINSNYKRVDYFTDFSLYVDDKIKVFAKDLKESEGSVLQYIGIMPIEEELDSYISNMDSAKIQEIIANLKDLKSENFKEGVVTYIKGYIPKFKFEYELPLKEDLKQLGITDIFTQGKANLTGISDSEDVYIADAIHKANIEFTQDGIKAAAATEFGGAGAGGSFDYIYEVPVEEIDLTFDKPYMFFIRDKQTGDVWFAGTVYEPLLWEQEPERTNSY